MPPVRLARQSLPLSRRPGILWDCTRIQACCQGQELMVEKETGTSVSGPMAGDADAQRSAAPAGLGPAEELPLLRAAWEALPDAVLLVRAATLQVVLANPAACRLVGYASGEGLGIGDWGLEIAESSQPPIPNPQSPIPFPPAAARVTFRARSGAAVPVECRVRAVVTSGDMYLVLIARAADAEKGRQGEGEQGRRGEEQSNRGSDSSRAGPSGQTAPPVSPSPLLPFSPSPRSPPPDDRDALTGLPDRRHFEGRLLVAMRKARSRADYHFAVLFIDLDGFKVVNDTWGHLHGDRVLQDIAARLHACIRPEDTVSRFGGDEFTVLVDHLHNPSDVVHVAERIQSQMQVPVEIEGRRATITASIGIALSWHGYRDPEAMLRDADRAMYRAKAEGKARYFIWEPQGERMKDEG